MSWHDWLVGRPVSPQVRLLAVVFLGMGADQVLGVLPTRPSCTCVKFYFFIGWKVFFLNNRHGALLYILMWLQLFIHHTLNNISFP